MNDAEIQNQEEILTKKRKLVADMEQNLSKAKKIKSSDYYPREEPIKSR